MQTTKLIFVSFFILFYFSACLFIYFLTSTSSNRECDLLYRSRDNNREITFFYHFYISDLFLNNNQFHYKHVFCDIFVYRHKNLFLGRVEFFVVYFCLFNVFFLLFFYIFYFIFTFFLKIKEREKNKLITLSLYTKQELFLKELLSRGKFFLYN